MKINKRERLLIYIFFILVFIYFGNKFAPEIFLKSKLRNNNYKNISQIYEGMLQNFEINNLWEERKQEILGEIDDLNVLCDIKQEQIIEILYKYLLSNSIEIIDINFSEAFPVSRNTTMNENLVETEEYYQSINNSEPNKLSALTMLVDIEFKSSYENMLSLIDGLQSHSIDMAITNIHVIKCDKDIVYGVMDINFYAIPMKCLRKSELD